MNKINLIKIINRYRKIFAKTCYLLLKLLQFMGVTPKYTVALSNIKLFAYKLNSRFLINKL